MSKRNTYFALVNALNNVTAQKKDLRALEVFVHMPPRTYVCRCVA